MFLALAMALIAPTVQSIIESPTIRGLIEEMAVKAIQEAENQLDDLIDEPLVEETEEMLEALRKAEENEALEKALKETADKLDDEAIYRLIDLGERLKKIKELPK